MRGRQVRHLAHVQHRCHHRWLDRRPGRALGPQEARREAHLCGPVRQGGSERPRQGGIRQGRGLSGHDDHLHAQRAGERLQRDGDPGGLRPGEESRWTRAGRARSRSSPTAPTSWPRRGARPPVARGCATPTGGRRPTRCAGPTRTPSTTRRASRPRPSPSRSWRTATTRRLPWPWAPRPRHPAAHPHRRCPQGALRHGRHRARGLPRAQRPEHGLQDRRGAPGARRRHQPRRLRDCAGRRVHRSTDRLAHPRGAPGRTTPGTPSRPATAETPGWPRCCWARRA